MAGRTHVAIVMTEYAEAILAGRKTIEARLTRSRRVPHGRVGRGDVVLFKARGGAYRARAVVRQAVTIEGLTRAAVRTIRARYDGAIGATAEFWRLKRDARFATLVSLERVERIESGPALGHAGRNGWVTLERGRGAV